MKMNQLLRTAGVAIVFCWCASEVFAQGAGGAGGGRGGRGGGNFDPAQMQQMRVDNYREQLMVTNDEEWNAIRPLVEKVVQAEQEVGALGGRGGGRGGRGGRGGAGGAGGVTSGRTPNPAVTSLQTAIDSSSTDQLKAALAKFRDARKQAQDKLTTAQEALKKVLTLKQEAVALRIGLVN